jgi:hypothetical protein
LMGVVLFLWGRQPSQKERVQLYQIHQRMTHLIEPTSAPDRRAA